MRRLLCHEPRGHADMYGCFLVPPDDAGARLGVLFWHKDGFSTACGHGTIALGAWAVESGLVAAAADGETDVPIDVPSGRVVARVRVRGRRGRRTSRSATCRRTCSRATCRSTHARSGASASTSPTAGRSTRACPPPPPASPSTRARTGDLIALGRAVKAALARHRARPPPERRPAVGRLRDDRLRRPRRRPPTGPRQRNVTVFADGEVDRSPCGSGTCARAALLHADGRLAPGRGPHARLDRRHGVRRHGQRRRPRRGPRRRRRRGRAAPPTAPASTASCSTPATRSGPASCCGERRAGSRSSTRPRSRALSPREAVDALEAALRAGLDPEADPPRQAVGAEAGEILLMPSASPGAVGVKLVTVAPGEPGPRAAADPGRLRAVRPGRRSPRPPWSTASR